MSNEITAKLYRSKRSVAEFPGVTGGDKMPAAARRNPGDGVASALLVKGVCATLQGKVLTAQVERYGDSTYAVIVETEGSSCTRTGGLHLEADGTIKAVIAPKGLTYGVTYHLTMAILAEALFRKDESFDLLEAYGDMLLEWEGLGRADPKVISKEASFQSAVLKLTDEIYYWLRYGAADPDSANDRVADTEIAFSDGRPTAASTENLDSVVQALTDPDAFNVLVHGPAAGTATSVSITAAIAAALGSTVAGGETDFIGWQYVELKAAVDCGEHVLLAGPTGSGKTLCTHEVLRVLDRKCVETCGMESLTDLDVIGAIVPRPGGAREWVDGPLTRALRRAQKEPVTFFLDEITRMPRVHLNLIPGLLNPQSVDDLRRQGVEAEGDGPFYTLELPMVSEVVWAPCAHFNLVAAGNFGRQYAVYDLDPAVRRRFTMVLEFDYLSATRETDLVVSRTALDRALVDRLVKVAAETRRLHANAELPGALDTGSLVVWAAKAHDRNANDAASLFHLARITWLDQVAGRGHDGRVIEANALAIHDLMKALGL
jgi:nitric oxide reductase NorQ protein